MTPDQYCQEKTRQSGSSFYYSFYFLPKAKRRAMYALYAFCREVDDIVDSGQLDIAQTKLNWWKAEIEHTYQGRAQHLVTRALLPAIDTFGLPQSALLEIIYGMEMDLTHTRYPNFVNLERYCFRVASLVGELTIHILGYTHPQTREFAHTLGLAFQLTNIIRDVGEDAKRGRIYLPQDELQQFGVLEADILQGKTSDEFKVLMDFQIQRASRLYHKALALLPKEDYRTQRVSLIMANIYRTLLRHISTLGAGSVLTHRISLSAGYKCILVLQTLCQSFWR